MVTWWLPDGYLVVTWWLPGGYLVVSWWLPGGYLVVFWWLPSGNQGQNMARTGKNSGLGETNKVLDKKHSLGLTNKVLDIQTRFGTNKWKEKQVHFLNCGFAIKNSFYKIFCHTATRLCIQFALSS